MVAGDAAPSSPSGSDGSVSDASSVDAGSVPEPALTLDQALQLDGENSSSERAILVIEAGCKQVVSCGGMQAVQGCVDETMSEWAIGALFFTEPCLDKQLDFYACIAKTPCAVDTVTSCGEQRMLQLDVCAET